MGDLDEFALEMPETTKDVSADGRPEYQVHGKMFVTHRSRRPDTIDATTGERLDDVLIFRVADLDEKETQLADDRGIYFTTPALQRLPGCVGAHPRASATRPRRAAGSCRRGMAHASPQTPSQSLAGRARIRE